MSSSASISNTGIWNGLPMWAKGAIAVAGTATVLVVGYKVYKLVEKTDDEKRKKSSSASLKSEIESLSKKMAPSFKETEYIAMADTIYEGMRLCVGDDYGTVENTLKKMKNDLDVAKLIKAYGSRQGYCFGIPYGSPLSLIPFVQSELGNEWGGITGYRVKNINDDWKKKGISYSI